MEKIITMPIELTVGRHNYHYDPNVEAGPSFHVNTTMISIDDRASGSDSGLVLDCDCIGFAVNRAAFHEKTYLGHPELTWPDVATCEHIQLLRRNFAPSLLYLTLEIMIGKGSPQLMDDFMQTREARIFRDQAFRLVEDYSNWQNAIPESEAFKSLAQEEAARQEIRQSIKAHKHPSKLL